MWVDSPPTLPLLLSTLDVLSTLMHSASKVSLSPPCPGPRVGESWCWVAGWGPVCWGLECGADSCVLWGWVGLGVGWFGGGVVEGLFVG